MFYNKKLLKCAIKSASENLILSYDYNIHFLLSHVSLSIIIIHQTFSLTWGARRVIDRCTASSEGYIIPASFHGQHLYSVYVNAGVHMWVWTFIHSHVYAGQTTSLLPFLKHQLSSLAPQHEHHLDVLKCGFWRLGTPVRNRLLELSSHTVTFEFLYLQK